MATVGRQQKKRDGADAPFTDVRQVVIVLLAVVLSFGAGATVAIVVAGAVGVPIGLLAGVSAGGAAAVALIHALDQLIG